jgi:hypothetical protein
MTSSSRQQWKLYLRQSAALGQKNVLIRQVSPLPMLAHAPLIKTQQAPPGCPAFFPSARSSACIASMMLEHEMYNSCTQMTSIQAIRPYTCARTSQMGLSPLTNTQSSFMAAQLGSPHIQHLRHLHHLGGASIIRQS